MGCLQWVEMGRKEVLMSTVSASWVELGSSTAGLARRLGKTKCLRRDPPYLPSLNYDTMGRGWTLYHTY